MASRRGQSPPWWLIIAYMVDTVTLASSVGSSTTMAQGLLCAATLTALLGLKQLCSGFWG